MNSIIFCKKLFLLQIICCCFFFFAMLSSKSDAGWWALSYTKASRERRKVHLHTYLCSSPESGNNNEADWAMLTQHSMLMWPSLRCFLIKTRQKLLLQAHLQRPCRARHRAQLHNPTDKSFSNLRMCPSISVAYILTCFAVIFGFFVFLSNV